MAKNKKQKAKLIDWLIRFWPLLIILGLVVVFAFPYWAKGKVPFPADHLVTAFPPWQYYYGMPVKNNAMPDVVSQMYPFKHLVIGLWKKGQLPLWNPYNFSGNSLLGNYQSAIFHPANFLFFILPEIDAWSLMILLQPFLAGLFTYLFVRQLGLTKPAACLSAAAFMFCGFITVWMAYGTLSFALLWLPLTLYAVEKSFKKLSAWSLALVSLSLTASFFSGHFQISLYVFLASLAYLVCRLIVSWKFKTFFICFLFIVLGVTLASVQILPTFELHQLSIRNKALGVSEIIPWRYMITILAPDFYGNAVTRNDWFGHYAEWSGFAGVIPLILAFYAVIKKKKGVWFFSLLALGALVLTRPTPLLDLLVKWKIPVLATSAAARVIGLFSFGVAILAGFGFDQLKSDFKERKFKPIFLISLLFLILFLVVWSVLLFKKPFKPENLLIAKRNFVLPSGMAAVFGGLVISFWLIQKMFKKRKVIIRAAGFIILSAILLLAIFDLFRFAQKWMPFDDRAHVYPSLPILEFLSKKASPSGRALQGEASGQALGASPDRVFGYFGMEMQNYYQIPGFNGYDPLYIQRYGELLRASDNGKIKLPSTRGVSLERRDKYTMNLLNLLGGKYILHAISDDRYSWVFNFWDYPDQFKQIYQDDKYEVYENLKVFPRAFMVYDYQVISEPQKIVDQMFHPEIDLKETLILEEEPELPTPSTQPQKQPKVEIVNYFPNKINLEVQTESPGLLFLSDNYYPGWQAFVSDKQTQIYRANYSFRAISVPEGKHQVKFIYQPNSFKLGAKISFLSLLALLGFSVLISKRKR